MNIGNLKKEVAKKTPLSLRKNFSWTMLGNIISAACKWVILVVIAKFGTPQLLGQFTLAYAITAPVFMFTNLQLRAIQATDAKNEYDFNHYFKIRLISNLVGIGIITFILLPVLNYNTETIYIVIVVGVIKFFESFSDVFYGQMQREERMDFVSRSMMIREISGLVIFTVILTYLDSLLFSLIGFAFIVMMIVINYDLVVSLKIEKNNKGEPSREYFSSLFTNWKWNTLKTIVFIALPLGIGVSLGSLVTNIPRYLVDYFLGQESLGYFAAIAYFIIGFSTLFNAIGQATRPRLAIYFEKNFKSYMNLLIKLLGISIIFGFTFFVISLFIGKEILSIVYSPSYSEYSDTLVLVALAAFFQSITSVLQIALQSARVFNVQIFISIISLVAAVLSGYVLIPEYGVEGAGLTVLVYSTINTLTVVLFFLKAVYFKKKVFN